MIKFFSPYLSFFTLTLASLVLIAETSFAQSSSAKQCPAINCDCGSIQGENWRVACQRHEERIKKACVANANTPKDYCSIHGLAAKPLPLSIQFSEYSLAADTDMKTLADKTESLYWLISSDLDEAKDTIKEKRYSRTLQILKLIDANIASLFEHQQKIESVYLAQEETSRSQSTWRKAGSQTKQYAKSLEAFGTELANAIDSAPSEKEKKIFSVLSKKAIRLAGLGFEHSGYAFGRAERHQDAAESWNLAANVSEKLLAIDKSIGTEKADMKFNELQAAARMHRMGYHYMLDEEVEDAVAALKSSQTFVNRQEQQFIGDLVDSLESVEDGEGILTGR